MPIVITWKQIKIRKIPYSTPEEDDSSADEKCFSSFAPYLPKTVVTLEYMEVVYFFYSIYYRIP